MLAVLQEMVWGRVLQKKQLKEAAWPPRLWVHLSLLLRV